MANAFRAFMPYILPLIGLLFWRRARPLLHYFNPAAWLSGYGLLALLASGFSLDFEASLYFGLAFLMNLLIPCTFFSHRGARVARPEVVLLVATWLILALFDVLIYVYLRDQLTEGYGIAGQIQNMTRSSGLARWFGVAGLLCFTLIWQGNGQIRWVFALPLAFCAWIVWTMQSRGGIFGFFAGMALLLIFSRSSWRAYALVFLVFLGLVGAGKSEFVMDKVKEQVLRGQTVEQFQSMTGRTRAYAHGWEQILEHPLIGRGNWADRMTIGEHVHNSELQALMNAGFLGFIPYMISWFVGWWLFYKLYRWRKYMEPLDAQLFMQAGAVMCFFTVRSIPETTTASFSVDSMLMVPVYIYLFVLFQRMKALMRQKRNIARRVPV
ncbi:O-antigen ligase family protein [Desulfobulbus rhabdoformis]|uniref:O-antigen ligase family protein n=1 Tax=Desulfobulbus rhabdoformis TaxID=34032 RepID=UPI00196596A8|nr:O-antigen ligase family protein [Desulfobulbus rhabdoformis]